MSRWNYVKNGNPKEEGDYQVTLVYPEYWNGEPTGKNLAELGMRYFDGEDWPCNQCGTNFNEKVWAWTLPEQIDTDMLPENTFIEGVTTEALTLGKAHDEKEVTLRNTDTGVKYIHIYAQVEEGLMDILKKNNYHLDHVYGHEIFISEDEAVELMTVLDDEGVDYWVEE